MRGFLSPDEKQFSDILCLLTPRLQSPTRCSAAPCHPTCVAGDRALALFSTDLCPPCTSFASGLRAPPLASQSFQVPQAHFLLLNIPENSSPTSQAFSCIFLRQRSLWPSAIPRTLQGLRGTILNADFYYYYYFLLYFKDRSNRKMG